MLKLNFDNGMRRFQVNGNAELVFNPSDPNVYARFMDAAEQLAKIEADMVSKGETLDVKDGEAVIRLMSEADVKIKEVLKSVFGEQNDFDKIFDGVNVMAVATNGERVITNFMVAIMPIVEEGAKNYAKAKAAAVAGEAKLNRAQRRAKK